MKNNLFFLYDFLQGRYIGYTVTMLKINDLPVTQPSITHLTRSLLIY